MSENRQFKRTARVSASSITLANHLSRERGDAKSRLLLDLRFQSSIDLSRPFTGSPRVFARKLLQRFTAPPWDQTPHLR